LKTFIISLCLFISFSSLAASFIDGRGHFFAESNDSLKFVKDQLLSSAFRDILTKELKNMGLDANHFWQQYDVKFEQHFTPVKESLVTKYRMEDGNVSIKNKERYRNSIRARRLRAKSKFGKLSRVIQSYSIKKFSRSTKTSNSRYVSLSAKVNRKILRNIFFKFTQEGKARHFKTLYITADFYLNAMTWLDAGVSVESDFTNVINAHWKKWFLENLNSYVDDIVIADVVVKEKIKAFARLADKRSNYNSEGGDFSEISAADEFNNSLWLKVKTKITKLDDDLVMKTREFSVNGDFILIDLKTNKLIKYFDFISENKKINIENSHALSSNLASMVYRIPISEYQEIAKSISALPATLSRVSLEVSNVQNMLELVKINELLASKGIAFRFESQINSYSGQAASLLLSFQGSNENIIDTLNTLNNIEIGPGRIITIESSANPFKFTIQENQQVNANET
jgi:hypothetical protein